VHIFVISLRSAQARRSHARREMAAAGVGFRFFDGVEGGSDPGTHFDAYSAPLYRINTRREPMSGEIGCYASHLALWRHCIALGEPVLVLEDDFQLLPGFAANLRQIEAATRDHGFLRLETFDRPRRRFSLRPPRRAQKVREYGAFSMHYLSSVPLCMLAYAISPSAAAALVEASATLRAPVDKFMQRTWEHRVPLFGISPPLVCTAALAGDSTIGVRPPKSRRPLLMILRLLDRIGGRIRRHRFNVDHLRRLRASPDPAMRLPVASCGKFNAGAAEAARAPGLPARRNLTGRTSV
jgi:glycosyl transferase family 25